jgi:hypothetical protein
MGFQVKPENLGRKQAPLMENLGIETPEREIDIAFAIHKLTYADGRAYGYVISDDAQEIRFVGKRTGLNLPSQTRLIEFFDIENRLVGRLQPPDVAPWLRAKRYEIYVSEEAEEPHAVIREHWRLVDILLLRLPRYNVQIGENHFIAQGSRYRDDLYGLFLATEEEVAEPEPEAVEEFTGFAPEDSLEDADLEDQIKVEDEPEDTEELVEPEPEDWGEFEEGGLELPKDVDIKEEEIPLEMQVGSILRSTAGPSYIVETDAEPLRETPLVMAALVALIDMEQHG